MGIKTTTINIMHHLVWLFICLEARIILTFLTDIKTNNLKQNMVNLEV